MNLNLNMKKLGSHLSPVNCQLSDVKGSRIPRSSASTNQLIRGSAVPRQSASSLGFTLLELLIVVSIIAILSVALIIVLNPAETLKKSRDSQRMSDLATMKTALGLYLTSTSTPYLGGNATNATCKSTPTALWNSPATARIFYSIPTGTSSSTSSTLDGNGIAVQSPTTASSTVTDGTGWIPVNFDSLTGGSPISNLPIDPVNTVSASPTFSSASSGDYVYRYGCSLSPLAFEIDAALESTAFASSSSQSDGGSNTNYYEVGTNLKILGSGNNF